MSELLAISAAEKNKKAALLLLSSARGLKQQLLGIQNLWNMTWKNRDPEITPDKVLMELGTEAHTIDSLAQAAAGLVNGTGLGSIDLSLPPGWSKSFNQDGSGVATFTAPQ